MNPDTSVSPGDREPTSSEASARGDALSLWRDLCEKDDRTSPEDYPDMALITEDEFVYVFNAGGKAWQERAATAERERDAAVATYEDEEAAHQDTLRLWKEAANERDQLRAQLTEAKKVVAQARRARAVIGFDLRDKIEWGPNYNQAVKDIYDRLTATLAAYDAAHPENSDDR
jgi:hypothetical protein